MKSPGPGGSVNMAHEKRGKKQSRLCNSRLGDMKEVMSQTEKKGQRIRFREISGRMIKISGHVKARGTSVQRSGCSTHSEKWFSKYNLL